MNYLKKLIGFNIQALQRKTEYDARLQAMPLGGMTIIGDKSCLDYAVSFTDQCDVVFRFSALDDGANNGKYASQYGKGTLDDARRIAVENIREIRTLIGTNSAYRKLWYQIGWDEKKDYWEWNAAYCIAAMQEADKDGLKGIYYNPFWGNPNHPPFSPVDEYDGALVEMFRHIAARKGRAMAGYHAYIDPFAPMTVGGQYHAQTRPMYPMDKMRKLGIDMDFALTEIGLTVRYPQAGMPSLEHFGNMLCVVASWFDLYPEMRMLNGYTLDKLDGAIVAGGKYESGLYPMDRDIFNVVERYNYANAGKVVVGPDLPAPSPTPVPTPTPTPTPVPDGSLKTWRVGNASELRVRSTPDATRTDNIAGVYYNGKTFKGRQIDDRWVKFDGETPQYCARYTGTTIYLTEVSP